ncbi:MAG TPA: hypothetical protein VFW62_08095 [bacterium]|nr:hypothetical protein [bacterium]
MAKLFFSSFVSFLLLWAFVAYPSEEEKVRALDRRIEQLEEMKRGYESRALRHENQAERLQFDNQAVLETRRHIQLAEENREKAALIQEEIDRLKAEREKLLEA